MKSVHTLQLATSTSGRAGIAACKLHKALIDNEFDSILLTMSDNTQSSSTFETYNIHVIVQPWKEILKEGRLLKWASQENKHLYHFYTRHVRSLFHSILLKPFDAARLLDSQPRLQELEAI